MSGFEYNAAIVNAYSSRSGGPGVDIGYELLRRAVGTRKWETISKTQDRETAVNWAARSGFKLRAERR